MIGPALIEPYLSRVPDELRAGLWGGAASNVIGEDEGGKGRAHSTAAEAGQGRASRVGQGRTRHG
jgi:hypothetical protein